MALDNFIFPKLWPFCDKELFLDMEPLDIYSMVALVSVCDIKLVSGVRSKVAKINKSSVIKKYRWLQKRYSCT